MSYEFGTADYRTIPSLLRGIVEQWCAELPVKRRTSIAPEEIVSGILDDWQLDQADAGKGEAESHMQRVGYDGDDLLEAAQDYQQAASST